MFFSSSGKRGQRIGQISLLNFDWFTLLPLLVFSLTAKQTAVASAESPFEGGRGMFTQADLSFADLLARAATLPITSLAEPPAAFAVVGVLTDNQDYRSG
ncbi:hypothetical protein EFA69_09985 [Rufibacter immobilis]|uniref:Uncharacterized protein n=1 Tax=Rufibacter immobilis TaxID=1348778 RepID=A0A3M9MXH1_9BACT|nr:hypothetical protein EFA69_09985 [Rufibacter immobilis]